MRKTDTSFPAFPMSIPTSEMHETYMGMTYRQWLIGQALNGVLANTALIEATARNGASDCERLMLELPVIAIRMADAAIDRLNQETTHPYEKQEV